MCQGAVEGGVNKRDFHFGKVFSFFYLRKSCNYEKLLTTLLIPVVGFMFSAFLSLEKNINPQTNKIIIHHVETSSMSLFIWGPLPPRAEFRILLLL